MKLLRLFVPVRLSALSVLFIAVGCMGGKVQRLAQLGESLELSQEQSASQLLGQQAPQDPDAVLTPQAAPVAAGPLPFVQVLGSRLVLQRDALDVQLLMRPMVQAVTNAPRRNATAAKVVSWQQRFDRVALIERQTQAIYETGADDKLIELFDIVAQDEQTVTIDLQRGLHAVPMGSSISTRDMPWMVLRDVDAVHAVLPCEAATLELLTLDAGGLSLHQRARVLLPQLPLGTQPRSPVEQTVYVTVHFSPLADSSTFVPRMLSPMAAGTAFQVPLRRKGDGAIDFLVQRWDLSPGRKPIVYEVAKEVPDDAFVAIAEGLGYWNLVAKRTILTVVRSGEDTPVAGGERRILVRWLPWRRGYFEVATVHNNPLTGEIVGGEIFLTTRLIEPEPELLSEIEGETLLERGYAHTDEPLAAQACMAQQIPVAVHVPPGHDRARQEHRQRLDALRWVVAHEAGHTLGMRHNFAAGSGPHQPSPVALRPALAAYQADAAVPEELFAQSVMNYGDVELPLIGLSIVTTPLPYDLWLFERIYGEELTEDAADSIPWYCTDAELRLDLMGCQAGFVGENTAAGALARAEVMLERLPRRIVDALVARASPERQPAIPWVDALSTLSPVRFTAEARSQIHQAFAPLRYGIKTLQDARRLEPLSSLDPLASLGVHERTLTRYSREIGGLPGLLNRILGDTSYQPDDGPGSPISPLPHQTSAVTESGAGWLARAVSDEVVRARAQGAWQMPGRTVALTPSQWELVAGKAEQLAWACEAEVAASALGEVTPFGGETSTMRSVDQRWQEPLVRLASGLILAKDHEHPVAAIRSDGRIVSATQARLPLTVRLAAVGLLEPKNFNVSGWGSKAREMIYEVLAERMVAVLDPAHARKAALSAWDHLFAPDVKVPTRAALAQLARSHRLSPELSRWALQELALVTALDDLRDPEKPSKDIDKYYAVLRSLLWPF